MLTTPNYPNIAYDPETGTVYRTYKSTDNLRKILPDGQYFLYANNLQGRLFRRKAHYMCWMIANGEVPDEHYVIQLQPNDLRLSNLKLLNKEEYIKYTDAEYNLYNISIKIESRKYTYVLRYMQEGKLAKVKGLEYDNALKLRNHLAGEARGYFDRLKEEI